MKTVLNVFLIFCVFVPLQTQAEYSGFIEVSGLLQSYNQNEIRVKTKTNKIVVLPRSCVKSLKGLILGEAEVTCKESASVLKPYLLRSIKMQSDMLKRQASSSTN